MHALNEKQINEKLGSIEGWELSGNSIQKEFKLNNFADALGFLVKIGLEAEKMDHHPDMLLHGWNKVKISLSTHSAGGITDNDFKLAHKIENIH